MWLSYNRKMPLKPETSLRKKLETLDRHKAMIDAMGDFIQAHPTIAADCSIHQLQGKVGLKFDEYALVVPHYKKDTGIMLKLVRSGEDWTNQFDYDELYGKRVVSEDISKMSDGELETLLEGMYREANPDADDEKQDEA